MSETITSKTDAPVAIEKIEQASSNFYWTYLTTAGAFNIQTTIRGILTPAQMQAHIRSLLEATAHVVGLGGLAKQIGKSNYDAPAEPLPDMTPVSSTVVPVSNEPVYVPEPVPQSAVETPELFFETKKLLCTIANGKMYYKVTGGQYPKHGVTVWPEVLVGANINPGKLEAKEYDFPGYKAIYIKNDKGQPQKVVKLEKVA